MPLSDTDLTKELAKIKKRERELGVNSNFESEKNEINSDKKLEDKDEINSENKVKKVKKDKDENRDTFIKIRVTKSEKEQIRRKAKESNFTMSDYSRKLILKKKIAKPKYSHEDAVMIATELREAKKELNKIGNNVNQIAKLANANPFLSDEDLNNLARIRFDFDAIRTNLISLNKKTGA